MVRPTVALNVAQQAPPVIETAQRPRAGEESFRSQFADAHQSAAERRPASSARGRRSAAEDARQIERRAHAATDHAGQREQRTVEPAEKRTELHSSDRSDLSDRPESEVQSAPDAASAAQTSAESEPAQAEGPQLPVEPLTTTVLPQELAANLQIPIIETVGIETEAQTQTDVTQTEASPTVSQDAQPDPNLLTQLPVASASSGSGAETVRQVRPAGEGPGAATSVRIESADLPAQTAGPQTEGDATGRDTTDTTGQETQTGPLGNAGEGGQGRTSGTYGPAPADQAQALQATAGTNVGPSAEPGPQPATGAAARAQAPDPAPLQTQTPIEQANVARVARGLNNAVNQQGGNLTLRLMPPDLGFVRISMQLDNGVVRAEIASEHPSVRALLTTQLDQLRTALESHGLTVERLSTPALPGSAADEAPQQGRDQDANDGRSRGAFAHQREADEDPDNPDDPDGPAEDRFETILNATG